MVFSAGFAGAFLAAGLGAGFGAAGLVAAGGAGFGLGVAGFAAEVGLSGEIRPVKTLEQRIIDTEKLGFATIFIYK